LNRWSKLCERGGRRELETYLGLSTCSTLNFVNFIL